MAILDSFLEPGPLQDHDLSLRLTRCHLADPAMHCAPSYQFAMYLDKNPRVAGQIHLRLGDSEHLTHYAGQVAFAVTETFRGHGLASRALKLLFGLARSHGMEELWITCNPANWASRKTCERSGATLVEIAEVPSDLSKPDDLNRCRYRIDLLPPGESAKGVSGGPCRTTPHERRANVHIE